MDPIVEIVEAAEREVLAHTIESTRGLRAYLCLHGSEGKLGLLQEEAVRRGLYRYMGERYAQVLGATLCRTRQCILSGRIQTEDALKQYLRRMAETLVRFRDLDLVIIDLLIEARQTGLYSLIALVRARSECALHSALHCDCKGSHGRARDALVLASSLLTDKQSNQSYYRYKHTHRHCRLSLISESRLLAAKRSWLNRRSL